MPTYFLADIEAKDRKHAKEIAERVLAQRFRVKPKGKIELNFLRRKFGISSYSAFLVTPKRGGNDI